MRVFLQRFLGRFSAHVMSTRYQNVRVGLENRTFLIKIINFLLKIFDEIYASTDYLAFNRPDFFLFFKSYKKTRTFPASLIFAFIWRVTSSLFACGELSKNEKSRGANFRLFIFTATRQADALVSPLEFAHFLRFSWQRQNRRFARLLRVSVFSLLCDSFH